MLLGVICGVAFASTMWFLDGLVCVPRTWARSMALFKAFVGLLRCLMLFWIQARMPAMKRMKLTV